MERFVILVTVAISFVTVQALHAAEASKANTDSVSVKCSLDRIRIEAGSSTALVAKADAIDRKKHALAYVWSGEGGRIRGAGSQVEIDSSNLQPGHYGLTVIARDAFENTDTCTIAFDIVEPGTENSLVIAHAIDTKPAISPPSIERAAEPKPAVAAPAVKRKEMPPPAPPVRPAPPVQETVSSRDSVAVACTTKSPVVEQGKDAVIEAEAKDPMGHSLRYIWYTNGGKIEGQGNSVELQTSGVRPAEYTVTARVEDGHGQAGDCNVIVKVLPPAPPPVPLQPSNIGQIVFLANRDIWDAKAASQLANVINRVRLQSAGRISLESYAGPDEKSPGKLASERAEAVKGYLVQNGISESRISIFVGLGGRRGGVRNRTLDVIWIPDGLDY